MCEICAATGPGAAGWAHTAIGFSDADGSAKPVYSNDQIADQLTDGYWQDTGRSGRSWDVTADAEITVSYSAMDLAGQWFAQQALDIWAAVTGMTFTTPGVPTSADITFDDESSGAFAQTWTRGEDISSVRVNVSRDWIANEQYEYDSYSLQTFLHEIGHAVGLGHAGNYNAGSGGTITYSNSAQFANDSWQASIMSYFSQTESTGTDATRAYTLTPTAADILAFQNLYGTSGSLRTSDTVYGVGSTAGDALDLIEDHWTNMAFTIIDEGGVDTVNFSDTGRDQRISLVAETFSDLGGERGNMQIARGTVIENAISGAGNDELVGNAADNRLDGGAGSDTLEGAEGIDTADYSRSGQGITADLGQGRVLTGSDTDTLVSIEALVGSSYDDVITIAGTTVSVDGGLGQDTLTFADLSANVIINASGQTRSGTVEVTGVESVLGGTGDDIFLFADTGFALDGGAGVDTADFSATASGLVLDLLDGSVTSGEVTGTLLGIENAVGTQWADTLRGTQSWDSLWGGDDNDRLSGRNRGDLLDGGAGDDVLMGGRGNDRLVGGQGDDRLFGGIGSDRLFGGEGSDLLNGDRGQDTMFGGLGDDRLFGKGMDDRLYGQEGNDHLAGGGGKDILEGGAGDDVLHGGSGSDRLVGQQGNDILRGGGGADVFVFAIGDGSDTVQDWDSGVDQLDLTALGLRNFSEALALISERDGGVELALFEGGVVFFEDRRLSDFAEGDILLTL